MPTLNQITYNIKNLMRGGNTSDDERISDRQLEFIVNYYRNILVKRDLDKGKSINPDIVQDLGCLELIEVDKAECCDTEIGCTVLRTKNKLPKTIELNQDNSLVFIGAIDKYTTFDIIPVYRVPFLNSKYGKKGTRCYYLNQYVYVLTDDLIEKINVRGIFEDPREAANFTHCDGTSCFTIDSTYPIAGWMLQPLVDMVLKNEMKIGVSLPNDDSNDASGAVKQQ